MLVCGSKSLPLDLIDDNGEPLPQAMIVNMIDQRVLKPTPQFLSYSVSKAGLYWLTTTLAQALGPRIRVNAVGPGPTLANIHQTPEAFAADPDLVHAFYNLSVFITLFVASGGYRHLDRAS